MTSPLTRLSLPTFLIAALVLLATTTTQAMTPVSGGTIATDTTWDLAGSPYVVDGNVIFQGTDGPDGVTTLTIEPGVVVEMGTFDHITVGQSAPGALMADGNAGGGPARILFTSSDALPVGAEWTGLRMGAQAQGSVLRNATISHSGRGVGFAGAVRVEGGDLVVEDVIFQDGGIANGAGIYVAGSTATVNVDSVQFNGNLGYDLRFSNGSGSVTDSAFSSLRFDNFNAQFSFSGNTIADWGSTISRPNAEVAGRLSLDNTFSAIPGAITEIIGGVQTSDGIWPVEFGEIHLLDTATVRGTDGADGITTLTIQGGMTIAVNNFDELLIGDTAPGALIADGDSGPTPGTILFTSLDPTPVGAEWGGLWFSTQARSSLVRNAIVEYAGRGGPAGALHIEGDPAATFTLDRLTVRENGNLGTAGLHLASGDLQLTAGAFENISFFDLRLEGGSGSIAGSSFSSITMDGDYPMLLSGNTLTNWGARNSRLSPNVAGQLAGANNVTAVPGAVTEVLNGTMTLDGTFGAEVGSYDLLDHIVVAGTDGVDAVTSLTMLPGTHVMSGRFAANRLEIGTLSGDPGRLVMPGGGPPVLMNESIPGTGGAGIWSGIRVLPTGTAALADAEIVAASIALDVRGTLESLQRTTFRRNGTGLWIHSVSPATPVDGLRCRYNATCVRTFESMPTIRNSELLGTAAGVHNDTPAFVVDAIENWWGDPSGPSGAGGGSGASVTSGVLFDPWLGLPDDDGDGVARDDGDGLSDPCGHLQTVDCDDNCPANSNASQSDRDGDGRGDACDDLPTLTVSSDPADQADFTAVQPAIDEAWIPGTEISIYPGLGPYLDDVRVDMERAIHLAGVESALPDRPIIDGGTTSAVFLVNGADSPHVLERLTIRGNRGIDSFRTTWLDDMVFETENGFGWYVYAGQGHRMTDSLMTNHGARVDEGASMQIDRSEILDTVGSPIYVEGEARVSDTVIAGGDFGIRLNDADANLELRFVTLVDSVGIGIDNPVGGSVTVADSIVYGNLGGDFNGLSCADFVRSNTGDATCAGTDGNLSAAPQLDVDYRLTAGSPCVDSGLDVALYSGWPVWDIDGDARLIDGDGDGTVLTDCGADEYLPGSSAIDEVRGVRWSDDWHLEWDAVAGAVEYHLYGGDLGGLTHGSYGTCQDGLDLNRGDTVAMLVLEPPAGSANYYLVTGENGNGDESILGFGTPAQRIGGPGCP